jgi:iron-sulfur cluster repair protein YtfE (RIC family)
MGFTFNGHRPLFMPNIRDFMAGDHLYCDGVFSCAERMVAAQDWDGAAQAFAQFQTVALQHFAAEETVIFPAFEEKTGMRMGPTQVMRGEHGQMRQLMEAAGAAVREKDADDFAGYAETLSIMMQQHNMKEENVLYPLCDHHLSDQTAVLVPQLQHMLPGRAE